MSAPQTHDPLVVNTKDGVVWQRRAVTAEGRGLYAVTGSCSCPEFLMATLAELAEHGIVGSAFALPMPVGSKLKTSERRSRTMLDHARDALRARMTKDDLRLVLENTVTYAVELERQRDAFRDQRNGVFATNERLLAEAQESDQARLLAENETRTVGREADALRARVAELESERHVTNGALDDAVQALRTRESEGAARSADRLTRLLAPTQALREDEAVEAPHPVPCRWPSSPDCTCTPGGQLVEWCTGCNTDHDPAECGYRPESGGA